MFTLKRFLNAEKYNSKVENSINIAKNVDLYHFKLKSFKWRF